MKPEPHEHNENCKQTFALLSEYLDAELPARTCEEIEAHLAGCPPCIEFLESLRRSIRLCHGFQTPEAPPPISEGEKQELQTAYQKMLEGRK
jgi:RNA polymerase sigma-70 factor (ECF subfamily)